MHRRAGRNIALHVRENTTLWDSAIRLFEDGDYGAAAETFSSMDYITAAVTFNIGTAYMSCGDYERAIEVGKRTPTSSTSCKSPKRTYFEQAR